MKILCVHTITVLYTFKCQREWALSNVSTMNLTQWCSSNGAYLFNFLETRKCEQNEMYVMNVPGVTTTFGESLLLASLATIILQKDKSRIEYTWILEPLIWRAIPFSSCSSLKEKWFQRQFSSENCKMRWREKFHWTRTVC